MRATIRRTTGAGIRRINRTPTTAPQIDASAITRASGQETMPPPPDAAREDRRGREHDCCGAVDRRRKEILNGVDPVDVSHPEASQDGEHEDADRGAEIAAVDGHQELESPGEEEHPAGRLAVGGGPRSASGEPGGKTGLEREQHRRTEDQPGDEPAEPGRGQREQKRGADDRPPDTRRQEPAGPAGQARLAIPLGTPRPGCGNRAGPEAEGAGRVGGHQSGRAIRKDRRHDREGEDRAPPRHGVDRCGDEAAGGEEQQLLRR